MVISENYNFVALKYKALRTIIAMITEEKATKLFCMTDDFCKEFALFYKKCMVENKKKNYDNKPGRMNDAKIVLIHHFVLFPMVSLQIRCLLSLHIVSLARNPPLM